MLGEAKRDLTAVSLSMGTQYCIFMMPCHLGGNWTPATMVLLLIAAVDNPYLKGLWFRGAQGHKERLFHKRYSIVLVLQAPCPCQGMFLLECSFHPGCSFQIRRRCLTDTAFCRSSGLHNFTFASFHFSIQIAPSYLSQKQQTAGAPSISPS